MLYLLCGEIQTGKTRWLERRVEQIVRSGAPVAGVLAPGVWRELGEGARFEKLGIDNVLLPGGERVHLALRRDLAIGSGALERAGQSERARLGWAMSDAALARVDAHLAWLADDDVHGREGFVAEADGWLVIDELGRLELLRGEGLVHGVELLSRGPRPGWPYAIAVVRRDLLPAAHALFDDAWSGRVREIEPSQRVLPAIEGVSEELTRRSGAQAGILVSSESDRGVNPCVSRPSSFRASPTATRPPR